MSLKVYNTLTGKKEEFKPRDPAGKRVGMYVCGVTVYDDCHLGHARGALTFDIIRRYLEYKEYKVTYIRNITDIDDKIIQRANELNISWDKIAKDYTDEYYQDMEKLGIQKADNEPKATEHMDDMQQLIQQLIDKGYAYEVDGDVYFEVRKFAGYGKLSGRKPDDMQAGARIEVDERKRDPLDFALWKAAKPSEPWWDSPWGKGRPGWHIECSAMSMRYLGHSFDIHGGGKDLIFPHHENEIAQSEAASGQPFVKYWLHNGFVQVDREKMSKSLGNFFTIKEILDKYPAEVVRLFLLSTHYRSPIDFSDKRLGEARKNLEGFRTLFNVMEITLREYTPPFPTVAKLKEQFEIEQTVEEETPNGTTSYTLPSDNDKNFCKQIENCKANFEAAMDDDFNTAGAIGSLNKLRKQTYIYDTEGQRKTYRQDLLYFADKRLKELGQVLGLFTERDETEKLPIPKEEIELLINQRAEAKIKKDWATADAIREKLFKLGIVLEDRAEGTSWRFKI